MIFKELVLGSSYKHGNKLSDSIKGREFLDKLNDSLTSQEGF
jgi:hypothetical protein